MTAPPMTRDAWPYFRHDPDCVVLHPRPGRQPSSKPPVRIFLGTEEAQYRAERVFFFSIEMVRDPSRVYELYLMKNIDGFDRRKWRTGFTNYRYAIPSFAGGQGRAIYNDVDQIYLADPALLFDLDMQGYAYLAISPKDTSVMLIDCERMIGTWNRENASRLGKHQLINKPAQTPGLWGKLDGHWNARDMEYVEGLTKCLHYTALHQQPWHPFPDDYSYHPNPLAYIWHDLEREADAQGYEVFDSVTPSPNFDAVMARNAPHEPEKVRVSDSAISLFEDAGIEDALVIDREPANIEFLRDKFRLERLPVPVGADWPHKSTDAVIAVDLLDRLPPADLAWVVGGMFSAARRVVYMRLAANEAVGMGSAHWWRKRVDEVARRFPETSWQLDVHDKSAAIPDTVITFQNRAASRESRSDVWALLDGNANGDAQVIALAEALGQAYQRKRLRYGLMAMLPNRWRAATRTGLHLAASDSLGEPWPALAIAADSKSAPVAGWIRKASGGRTRVVQLGCPQAAFDLFDLVVTTPEYRLPVRDNVMHIAAPLGCGESGTSVAAQVCERLSTLPVPRTLLVAGRGHGGYRFDAKTARRLGELANQKLQAIGGSLVLWFEPDTPQTVRDALRSALNVVHDDLSESDIKAPNALIAEVDRAILTGDRPELIAAFCLVGKPVDLFELRKWYDAIPGARLVASFLTLVTGGGTSYRGTPHQQHLVSRGIDELVTKGFITLPRDLGRFNRGLLARGLVTRLDDDRTIATRKPLNDLELTVIRVRRLLVSEPRSDAR